MFNHGMRNFLVSDNDLTARLEPLETQSFKPHQNKVLLHFGKISYFIKIVYLKCKYNLIDDKLNINIIELKYKLNLNIIELKINSINKCRFKINGKK